LAVINLPEGFKYLDPKQSKRVLVDIWGNPDREEGLGMLFPSDKMPADPDSWAIDIQFEEEGYIEDEDAAELDYTELLQQMKEGQEEANEERAKLGYEKVDLVGWAVPPYYDSKAKKLHWAKEIKFGEQEENTLNYNIRILGRKGVLVLNIIGGMSQLEEVKPFINPILAQVEFKEGNRYEDFTPGVDQVAAYGIGGLIAGKVLAKAGIFAALLKFWKIIAVGFIAALGAAKKFIFGSNEEKA